MHSSSNAAIDELLNNRCAIYYSVTLLLHLMMKEDNNKYLNIYP